MNENDFDPFNNGSDQEKINLSKEGRSPSDTQPEFPYTNPSQGFYGSQPSQQTPPPPPPPSQQMYGDFGRNDSLNQKGTVPPAYVPDPSAQYYQQPQGYPQQQYGYQQQTYPQYQDYSGQNPYAGYSQNQTGLATASMVIGIISLIGWLAGAVMPLLLVVPAVGIILGIVHKTKHDPVGKGKSTAGIIMSAIGLVLPIVLWILIFTMLPSMIDYLREADPETYQQIYDQYADQLPGFFSVLFSVLIK